MGSKLCSRKVAFKAISSNWQPPSLQDRCHAFYIGLWAWMAAAGRRKPW
jgi:hypothetical protein